MSLRAGRIVTAADLSWRADDITLPDAQNPPASQAWGDWGSTITFPNPDAPVIVLAWGSANSFNATTSTFGAMRLGISFTGGGTWANGGGPRDSHGQQRGTQVCQHVLSGTPTGDIVVRAQIQSDSTGTTFHNGTFMALVLPLSV